MCGVIEGRDEIMWLGMDMGMGMGMRKYLTGCLFSEDAMVEIVYSLRMDCYSQVIDDG